MNMRVDGKSPLTQFVGTMLRQRDLIMKAVDRDNEALRILSAPALSEAMARVERRFWANKAGHKERKVWTQRDERRLNLLRGFFDGYVPACRVARLVGRFRPSNGFAPHDMLFQNAIEEARNDGTASALASLLHVAFVAHNEFLQAAHLVSQDDDEEQEFNAAVWELSGAVSSLLPFAKPAGDSDDDSLESEVKKRRPTAATVVIIRAIQSGKDNDSVVAATSCSAEVVRGVRSKLKAGKYEI